LCFGFALAFETEVTEKNSVKYTKVKKKDLEFIRSIVGPERLSSGESILDLHSKDESFHQRRKPDAVVWPLSVQEISQILKLADAKRIPVTPWGAGTSLEGNPIPVEAGIVLDLQQMNHILELKTEDLQVRVEAGEEIVHFAIECGGTATGEHGIGIGKRKFMKKEHGESLILMKQIKKLLDPNGIINPGKMFE
jgi:FAD/FMN-containing dehydrogenase